MGTYSADFQLHQAVHSNNIETVRGLLSSGANTDIDARDTIHGHIPLNLAINIKSNKTILKLLLNAGASVHVRDKEDLTPLYTALRWKDIDVIKILIDAGADVNDVCTKNRSTALHCAVQNNSVSRTEYLLSQGANVNFKDNNKLTPLHYVTLYNQLDSHFNVAEILLKNKANIDAQYEFGRTPFYRLICQANVRIVQLFLNYKSKINIPGKSGHIPLFEAICTKNFEDVKLLVTHGSDINKINLIDGSTTELNLFKTYFSI